MKNIFIRKKNNGVARGQGKREEKERNKNKKIPKSIEKGKIGHSYHF